MDKYAFSMDVNNGKVMNVLDSKEAKDIYEATMKIAEEDIGTKEKRSKIIKVMMDNPSMRQKLKITQPDLYKEGLKLERGDAWKPTLKDVQKALNLTEDELYDAQKGWQGIAGKDLDFLAQSEGMLLKDIIPILREAQTKHDRQQLWNDQPTSDKLLMGAIAPFTSEALASGEKVDDMKTADKVGLIAGLVPVGSVFKAAGPIGRATLDAFAAPVASSIAGVASGEMDPLDAAIYASGGGASNLGASGLLKSGLKGLKGLGSAIGKNAKKTLNETEDALKEGFYRVDLEKRINKIQKALNTKNLDGLSAEDLKLLDNFNNLKKLGADWSKLGKFDQAKLDKYLADLKKLSPDLYNRRADIKNAISNPIEQVKFDINPGTIRATDILRDVSPEKLRTVGWTSRAGLTTPRKAVNATLKGHEGVSKEAVPDLETLMKEYDIERLGHTDPVYPRVNPMDESIAAFFATHPQLKAYFDKSYKDPAVRDYILQVLIPNIATREGKAATSGILKTKENK